MTESTATVDQLAPIVDQLAAIVGDDHCLQGDAALPYCTDVYRALETPLAVVRVRSVEELQDVLRLANSHALPVSIRGGGASYTDGYLALEQRSVLLDLSALDRIVEINEKDCFVTVEAGVTWAALSEALAEKGWRTPFRGPFSGMHATVGGSMSQNALSHGSGAYGISAQSAQSFDVLTADGSLLRTGSGAVGDSPFSRHFGPDLTGLFTGDCGVFGIKVRVTLPLLRPRPAHRVVSFAFPDFIALHEGMRLIASEQLDESQFALDQALSQGQIAKQDKAGEPLKLAWSIFSSSPSWFKGLLQLLQAGISARKTLGESAFMAHYIVEGVDDAEARSRLHRIRQLALAHGREIVATVPALVRGMPFTPFFNTLGPAGERWVPLHGVLAHSQTVGFHRALEQFYAQRETELEALGIWYGGMFATVGSSGFLYEIALYWPDEITAYHRAVVPADYLAALPVYPANPKAREYVHQLKIDLAALYAAHGAINFQIGRFYPYRERLAPQALGLIESIKGYLDPNARLSPGVLGLDAEHRPR
ncbi:MAG: glycolate oxidase [Halieaceae bacterium]|jgi:glycolate oxidase